MFQLHETLNADTLPITRLSLCEARLMNNRLFPWVLLVPMVEDARDITDLTDEAQLQLMREISLASGALQTITQAEKMNVAALGNQVAQLHVHVIARFRDDTAWPNPVWGADSKAYEETDAQQLIEELKQVFKPNNG